MMPATLVEYTLRGGALAANYDDTLADYTPALSFSSVVPDGALTPVPDGLTRSFTLDGPGAKPKPLVSVQSFVLTVDLSGAPAMPERFVVRLWVWVKGSLAPESYDPFPAPLKTKLWRLNAGEVQGQTVDGQATAPPLAVDFGQLRAVYRMRLELRGLFDVALT